MAEPVQSVSVADQVPEAAPGTAPMPASAPAPVPALLGFIAAEKRWLLDPRRGVHVMDAAITPVPLTRPWYLGLVRYRQKLLGVIDLAGLRGAFVSARAGSERLLVLPEPSTIALRVERVFGLIDAASLTVVDAHSLAPSPSSASGADAASTPWHGAMLVDADGACWQMLDVAQLCMSPVFLQAGVAA